MVVSTDKGCRAWIEIVVVCDGVIVRIQGIQIKKWRPRGTVTVPLESIHNTTGGMASTVPLIFGYRSLFEEIGSKRFLDCIFLRS
jgi:hypothetical protein